MSANVPAGEYIDPATGRPPQQFVDGIPIDPATGRQIVKPPGATNQPAWTAQLQMPQHPGATPGLVSSVPPPVTSPVPQQSDGAVPASSIASAHADAAQVVQQAPDGSVTQIKVPGLPVMGAETGSLSTGLLPAMPASAVKPAAASDKCITEGCKSKPKDRGMCARCLKDTLEYMAKDKAVTWEFLEANGLALPSSSARSGNKFLKGLTAKLAKLHASTESNIMQIESDIMQDDRS